MCFQFTIYYVAFSAVSVISLRAQLLTQGSVVNRVTYVIRRDYIYGINSFLHVKAFELNLQLCCQAIKTFTNINISFHLFRKHNSLSTGLIPSVTFATLFVLQKFAEDLTTLVFDYATVLHEDDQNPCRNIVLFSNFTSSGYF